MLKILYTLTGICFHSNKFSKPIIFNRNVRSYEAECDNCKSKLYRRSDGSWGTL